MPPWRDVLILASVTITVASAVAYFGLHLLKSGYASELEGLPDVMSARCLDPSPSEHSAEYRSSVNRATHP